jgi:hypothetical protein
VSRLFERESLETLLRALMQETIQKGIFFLANKCLLGSAIVTTDGEARDAPVGKFRDWQENTHSIIWTADGCAQQIEA